MLRTGSQFHQGPERRKATGRLLRLLFKRKHSLPSAHIDKKTQESALHLASEFEALRIKVASWDLGFKNLVDGNFTIAFKMEECAKSSRGSGAMKCPSEIHHKLQTDYLIKRFEMQHCITSDGRSEVEACGTTEPCQDS